ncbi:MAG: translation initiation factor IF-2, partial [Chryseobacterium sp.]|nr:translation initiation factor IF-2 [Chryseobacterium sp.]
ESGQRITFLDTPGHEAFTAMRARGAQITDIAIIVVAADDDVMPQTKEAIAHAQAAGVPMIIAINKVDKAGANPDKIREQLSAMNVLVEEWGGNVQAQEISAKFGNNVDLLLEKVLLQAEMLELKSNPNKQASGVVIEAALDKGRGYVATMLVQNGTLKVGDYVLAGKNHGKVKAMLDERGKAMETAGPSIPVTILGLDGAPTAGDKFRVFADEKEAKTIANKREQLQREQSIRTKKHLTLDEIGRRIALGDFKELNIILKGDVDGSVEALSDQLQRLSTEEIQVNILHKGVGQITESDVLLAAASDAIMIGFNVRASVNAKDIADKEEVEIRTYSIIYRAIDEVKEAMEGMLSPEIQEQVIGNVEIREVFRISKVGSIAGCMVLTGKVTRNSSIRLLRDGIVKFDGELESLKRFKDDVKEVTKGYECGLNIKGYNDIEEGDILEVYEEVAVKKKLK